MPCETGGEATSDMSSMLADPTRLGLSIALAGEVSRLIAEVDRSGVEAEHWLVTLLDDIEGVRSWRLFGVPS